MKTQITVVLNKALFTEMEEEMREETRNQV